MTKKKPKLTPQELKLWKTNPVEFFRRMGAKGGQKRNRLVTKEQIRRWGRQGGKKSHPR